MARTKKATAEELLRLDAIGAHLAVKRRYPDTAFAADVSRACLDRVAPILDKLLPCTGEEIALGLAEHLHLTFEEVHGPHDVEKLEERYLKLKREIGFAQLRPELAKPGVDALLFQRMHASERDRDRWVAVLNLQESDAKGYWNRFHELGHRIAEPPQAVLPFRRHQFEATNPVEALIDSVAADIAFYPPAVRPSIVDLARYGALTFDLIDTFRHGYAPTASLLSTMKAMVKFWPTPAAALTSEVRGRRGRPDLDRALRVAVQGCNDSARAAGMVFFPNMRVPPSSPIEVAFESGADEEGREDLGQWRTSSGSALAPREVLTCARGMGRAVYAVVSA